MPEKYRRLQSRTIAWIALSWAIPRKKGLPIFRFFREVMDALGHVCERTVNVEYDQFLGHWASRSRASSEVFHTDGLRQRRLASTPATINVPSSQPGPMSKSIIQEYPP